MNQYQENAAIFIKSSVLHNPLTSSRMSLTTKHILTTGSVLLSCVILKHIPFIRKFSFLRNPLDCLDNALFCMCIPILIKLCVETIHDYYKLKKVREFIAENSNILLLCIVNSRNSTLTESDTLYIKQTITTDSEIINCLSEAMKTLDKRDNLTDFINQEYIQNVCYIIHEKLEDSPDQRTLKQYKNPLLKFYENICQ
ncbi:uncharacterized protein LOC119683113 [Teleopsis dalmanni]|uniref:uncharacterized protein LOC119683113 n=1 Tax=Teleopsis dalmanni TaxID=139649 RepID=UPI0018CF1E95|nr:uncharacterized protein LOC119683113 [Teleopsis dalmanni]